jgi:magnesium transporter
MLRALRTAALLGAACGIVVAAIVVLWRGEPRPAAAIGLGILSALVGACVFGLSVPAALHALRLDPKIAAGPVSLACTDVFTLLCYFSLATLLLG